MDDKRKESNEKKKENLEVSLMKKRECFVRAKKVVERLLEEDITEHLLLESVKYITQSHYQDVVEERVILKLCGYAVCNNKLENIPVKKFHISAATNMIYDITERKNFCSSRCYKASTFLKEQVLTSPVWLRDLEEIPQFKLLPTHEKGGKLGEVVALDISKLSLQSEDKHIIKNQMDFVTTFALNTLQELEKAGGHCYENLFIKEQNASSVAVASSIEKVSNIEEQASVLEQLNDSDRLMQEQKKNYEKNKAQFSNNTTTSAKSIEVESVKVEFSARGGEIIDSVEIKPENVLKAETEKSCPAQSEMTPKLGSPINHSTQATDLMKTSDIVSKIESQPELKNIKPKRDKIIEIKERVVEISNKEVSDSIKRPVAKVYNVSKEIKQGPERIEEVAYEWFTVKSAIYLFGIDTVIEKLQEQADVFEASILQESKLEADNQFIKLWEELEEERQRDASNVSEEQKKELTHLELKVQAFYEGKFRIAPSAVQQDREETIKPILPDVDRYSQKSARQKIVLSRLSKVLMELFEIFGIASQDVTTQVLGLLQTFNLESHNIMLRPNEWNLMGLLIIKMLCEKDKDLKKMLSRKKSLKRFSMMLESFQLMSDYLDVLISRLCGMQNLPRTK